MKTLADRVNAKMAELGIKQDELAKMVGISQPSIQRITSGVTKNPKKIVEISKALKTTPEWLATGTGNTDSVVEIKTSDPLSNLTDLQRELILRMNSLSKKQQQELLIKVEEQARQNEEFLADYLVQNQKRA